MVDLDDSPRIGVAFWRKRDTLQCLWSVASEQPTSAARARLRLPGAVAHEQSAATSSVILFTRRVHGRVYPRKLAAVRVRCDVHRVRGLEEVFDPRKRHPVETADAEWCQPARAQPAELALDA